MLQAGIKGSEKDKFGSWDAPVYKYPGCRPGQVKKSGEFLSAIHNNLGFVTRCCDKGKILGNSQLHSLYL